MRARTAATFNLTGERSKMQSKHTTAKLKRKNRQKVNKAEWKANWTPNTEQTIERVSVSRKGTVVLAGLHTRIDSKVMKYNNLQKRIQVVQSKRIAKGSLMKWMNHEIKSILDLSKKKTVTNDRVEKSIHEMSNAVHCTFIGIKSCFGCCKRAC